MESDESGSDLCHEVMREIKTVEPLYSKMSRADQKAVTFNSKETRYDASSYTSEEHVLDQPDVDDYITDTDNSQDENEDSERDSPYNQVM